MKIKDLELPKTKLPKTEFQLLELIQRDDPEREGIPNTDLFYTCEGQFLPEQYHLVCRLLQLGYIKVSSHFTDITDPGLEALKNQGKN